MCCFSFWQVRVCSLHLQNTNWHFTVSMWTVQHPLTLRAFLLFGTKEKKIIQRQTSYLRVEVDHGCRLYVLLPEHLHLHWRIGKLVGEVVQEVWEVGCCSMDDPHHKTCSLGLILAERQGHKLLGETLHLSRGQRGELLTVSVRHGRSSVGLLFDVDQVPKLQAGQSRRWGAVERGAVAKPVPDHGGDGGRGSGCWILVVLLWWWCCVGVE